MRTKIVLRYYCDHCNKGGFKKMGMTRHESICIYNPLRECGVCDDYKLETRPISVLIEAIEQSLQKLRDACQGCPACILAAIVQSKGPIRNREERNEEWVDFDYKKELSEFHSENDRDAVRYAQGLPF